MAKILVIDDDPMITHMLKTNFEIDGHSVEIGFDGDTAIEYAKTFNPDIIVMDIGMPTISGLDALACIRERPETHAIPIIFVSGLDSRHLDSVIDEYKRIAYVRKPINLEGLNVLVQMFLTNYYPAADPPPVMRFEFVPLR